LPRGGVYAEIDTGRKKPEQALSDSRGGRRLSDRARMRRKGRTCQTSPGQSKKCLVRGVASFQERKVLKKEVLDAVSHFIFQGGKEYVQQKRRGGGISPEFARMMTGGEPQWLATCSMSIAVEKKRKIER